MLCPLYAQGNLVLLLPCAHAADEGGRRACEAGTGSKASAPLFARGTLLETTVCCLQFVVMVFNFQATKVLHLTWRDRRNQYEQSHTELISDHKLVTEMDQR